MKTDWTEALNLPSDFGAETRNFPCNFPSHLKIVEGRETICNDDRIKSLIRIILRNGSNSSVFPVFTNFSFINVERDLCDINHAT